MQKLLSFNYIYLIPLSLSAIASLRSFRSSLYNKPYRIFSVFLMVSLGFEIFAISWKWGLHHTGAWNFPKSNLWIYNVFLIVQFVFYSLFYYGILKPGRSRNILSYFILPLATFGIINYFFVQTPQTLNSYSIIAYYFSYILLSLLFFHQLLQEREIAPLQSHPAVWISAGTFIFFTGALPYSIFLPYLVKQNPGLAVSLFNINLCLDTLMYLLYLISFLCKPLLPKQAC